MNRKKWSVVACLGLLVAVLLSGCASRNVPIPEDMDEQALLAAGQTAFDLLMADEYEQVCDLIRADIIAQAQITPEKIREQMDKKEEYGRMKKVNETWTSGVPADEGANIEEHVVVWYECEFPKKRLVYGFAFDLDLNLIGMSVNRE